MAPGWNLESLTVILSVSHSVSCPTLCDPMDFSPPGFSVHVILRAEYWSGLLFPSSGDLPDPGIEPASPALAGGSLTTEPPGKLDAFTSLKTIFNLAARVVLLKHVTWMFKSAHRQII